MADAPDWPAAWARCLAARLLAPATQQAYARDLAVLQPFCPEDWRATQNSHIRAALRQSHARGLSPRSLARMLAAWRQFFDWLMQEKQLSSNPCAGLRPPKADQALPQVLSVDQAQALLDQHQPEDALERRDAAMFELMYSSGLRAAEVVGARCLDLNLDAAELRVLGKGQKMRVVPVGQQALAAIRQWLVDRALLAQADEAALFVNQHGVALTVRTLERRLQRWQSRTGLAVPVHPHMLRHSCASHLLQSSGDLRAVQEMLGHASLGTTQIYTHLDFQHLAQVYDAAHPRAKKKVDEA